MNGNHYQRLFYSIYDHNKIKINHAAKLNWKIPNLFDLQKRNKDYPVSIFINRKPQIIQKIYIFPDDELAIKGFLFTGNKNGLNGHWILILQIKILYIPKLEKKILHDV